MRSTRNGTMTALVLALLGTLGCGGGSVEGVPKKLVPFSGTVTIDGKPAIGATLQFLQDGTQTKGVGASSYGVADQAGKYTLKYRGEKEGVPPGTYKVVISRMAMPDGSPVPSGMSPTDAGAVESLAPEFSNPESSQQTVIVGDKGGTQNYQLSNMKK